MDTRLDAVAKAVARGATRRQALRLAGGGLAGALLAAVGLGDLARRARAQPTSWGPQCDEFHARCAAQTVEACVPAPSSHDPEWSAWYACMLEQRECQTAQHACPTHCTPGKGACSQCREHQVCVTALNPANQLMCRCVSFE